MLSNAHFCVICKEFANPRFVAEVTDRSTELMVAGGLCSHCYDTFVSSSHNAGMFRVAKMRTWLRHWRKDRLRMI